MDAANGIVGLVRGRGNPATRTRFDVPTSMTALALVSLLVPTAMRRLAIWSFARSAEGGDAIRSLQASMPTLCGALDSDDPASLHAAIDVLAAMPGKRILVLGEMSALVEMEEIGAYAKRQGVDVLLAMGEQCESAARNFGVGGRHFNDADLLMTALNKALTADSAVLVQGTGFGCRETAAEAPSRGVVDVVGTKQV